MKSCFVKKGMSLVNFWKYVYGSDENKPIKMQFDAEVQPRLVCSLQYEVCFYRRKICAYIYTGWKNLFLLQTL